MKKVIWNDCARDFVRSLDHQTKIEIGTLIMMLQAGESLAAPQKDINLSLKRLKEMLNEN